MDSVSRYTNTDVGGIRYPLLDMQHEGRWQRPNLGPAGCVGQGSRPIMWYSRLGSMPVADAMRLVKLYIAAVSMMSKIA